MWEAGVTVTLGIGTMSITWSTYSIIITDIARPILSGPISIMFVYP